MLSRNIRNILAIALLVALGGILAGCAGQKKEVYIYPFPKKIKKESIETRVKGTLEAIRERNETVENSPEWLHKAYQGILIKDLRDVPPEKYADYNKYVRGGRAFIIVHPSFFTFFDIDDRLAPEKDVPESHPQNLVERFYNRMSFFDDSLMILQLQERDLMGFIEVFTTEKVLLVMIIPRDYEENINRNFVGPRNEYARYVNEVTNESEGALFIESSRWNSGTMLPEDIDKVVEFLQGAGVRKVYLGGGYVGRCLDSFYLSIRDKIRSEGLDKKLQVRMVPEMAGVSPFDLVGRWANGLLTPSGKINRRKAAYNLSRPGAYTTQKLPPKITRFYVHEVELGPRANDIETGSEGSTVTRTIEETSGAMDAPETE